MTDLYEQSIRAELAVWPNVVAEFGRRSKHREVTFRLGGRTRFIIIPDSPSDGRRGHLNMIRDMRKELALLGAARREKSPPVGQRKRGPARPRIERDALINISLAPVKPDPFAELARLVAETPPTPVPAPSFWERVLDFLVRFRL